MKRYALGYGMAAVKGFFGMFGSKADNVAKAASDAGQTLAGKTALELEALQAAGKLTPDAIKAGLGNIVGATAGAAKAEAKTSLLKKGLMVGGVAAGVEAIVNGKDGLVGGALTKGWTELGKIEAEQNTVGRFHGLYKMIDEVLKFFGIEGTALNNWVDSRLEQKRDDSAFAHVSEGVSNSLTAENAATIGGLGLATGGAYLGYKALRGRGGPGGGNGGGTPTPGGDAPRGGGDAPNLRGVDAADDVARAAKDVAGTHGLGRGKSGLLMTGAGALIGGSILSQTFAGSANAGTPDDATITADNTNAAPTSVLGEVAHKGHVLAHGVQSGLVGLGGSLEDVWDMADNWSGGWLPGDDKKNSTANFLGNAADSFLISKPEIRGAFDQALHTGGEVATWFIPVGAAAKGIGAGARTVTALRTMEQAENTVGVASVAQSAANWVFRPS